MTIAWGPLNIAYDDPYPLEIGNLCLNLSRSPQEWAVEYHYTQDRYVTESSKATSRIRVVSAQTNPEVTIIPATADRSVVARPTQTIQIPAGESTTLYISTPLWIRAKINDQTTLFDLPVEILSDCWFGQTTRKGELCYANPTQARMYLERLPVRPERVVTPANIRNEGDDVLTLDRLSLPLPHLSIYKVDDSYWTQQIVITRTAKLDLARLELEPAPPQQHSTAELITGPRKQMDDTMVERVLGLFF